jgi:hypothetical protein
VEHAWPFLPLGYLLSVLVEAPVLLVGLSAGHPPRRKLLAALWLTACTYPVVILVLPHLADPIGERTAYLLLAETFAPLAECLLFVAAFAWRWRDCAAIVLANLLSFAIGEALFRMGAFA